ncbi:unnamed protein product [Sphenostylis stenocarpa]|uniref:Uncharacterized protein n=1 Tax=Sphenostylis stenocarpa TaxID=92480 RepID=A0AA86VP81_9FABA|nr:unnamed protein product [Sphenostylis stenocarpa]
MFPARWGIYDDHRHISHQDLQRVLLAVKTSSYARYHVLLHGPRPSSSLPSPTEIPRTILLEYTQCLPSAYP